MYNLQLLKPVAPVDLVRLGRKKDGGYVLPKRALDISSMLISFGISTDWSFEAAWVKYKRGQSVQLEAYDYSVDGKEFLKLAWHSVRKFISTAKLRNLFFAFHYITVAVRFHLFFNSWNRKFYKLGISNIKSLQFRTFDEIIQNLGGVPQRDSLIIKMDIEGAEYITLEHTFPYHDSISAYIIEFHELDEKGPLMERLISRANEHGFIISHVHANNGSGYLQETNRPQILEITLVKASHFTNEELDHTNTSKYPIAGLDYPCVTSVNDLPLTFD